jgi:PII-like signaling protein
MIEDCLELTTYFGERDRVGDRFLADALIDIYARHELRISLMLRGVEGFGLKHHLHTDRLLTLSEDLPLVAIAVDTRQRVEAALADVETLRFDGLVTLERARMVTAEVGAAGGTNATAGSALDLPAEPGEAKLTVYLGRQARVGARPAYEAVVALLRARGVAGASVLLGVDGTVHGTRHRARFFARNGDVPLMVIAVGDHQPIGAAIDELHETLPASLMTLERAQVCKRDGELLAQPSELPPTDHSGLAILQKLTVYAGEQSRHAGEPQHLQLIRALRAAGAAGATSLRGMWGYHGDHEPHGDSFWQLRRRVPLITTLVDTPARIRDWFAIVDELTDQTGLVTSELVPAFRATFPQLERAA